MRKLIENQKEFYREKFRHFGDDPKALGYNDGESQRLRFKLLRELFRYEKGGPFSVHEVGCGLAHFWQYAQEENMNCEYSGSDICENFISRSKTKFPAGDFFLQDMSEEFACLPPSVKEKDYYVVSGMFNPMNDNSVEEWEKFLFSVVDNMFRACRKGIAFNLLTLYSQENRRSKSLYYSDPKTIYDWCNAHLSRFVTVIADTPLYEFTVLVYREAFIKTLYPSVFDKYFRS